MDPEQSHAFSSPNFSRIKSGIVVCICSYLKPSKWICSQEPIKQNAWCVIQLKQIHVEILDYILHLIFFNYTQ